MPGDFSDADKKRLTAAYREMIEGQALPAFRKLRTFIADEYLPATRESVGLDKLPNGEQWYAFNAQQSTTPDMTPAEIHQLGLDEVARIHGEISKVMAEAGFDGTLQEFFGIMKTDPQFSFESEDALLPYYRSLDARINKPIHTQSSLVHKPPFQNPQ